MKGHDLLKKLLAVIAGLGMMLSGCQSTSAPTEAPAQEPLRVAIVFPGPVNDQGWCQSAYTGAQKAVDEFGVDLAYSESVPAPEFEAAIRDYASKGYDLVIAHGFQFQDAVLAVAPQFPDVRFIINAGEASAEHNVASTRMESWQAGYLDGAVAGLITKSNVIAFIGGMEIPIMVENAAAVEMGAKAVNPGIEVLTTYVGSWTDVAKGKETALALIDQGADVVIANANIVGLGSIAACSERGVYAVGTVTDQTDVAPDTVVASGLTRGDLVVWYGIKHVVDGTFEPKVYRLGIGDGVEDLAWNPAFVDQFPEAVERLEEIKRDIQEGNVQAPVIGSE
jgi:basic membrane protein A